LAAYAVFLAVLLLFEMTAGILGFIFKDWVKNSLQVCNQWDQSEYFSTALRLILYSSLLLFFLFQIKEQATNGFQAFIVHYRDDPDQQV